MQAIFRWVWTCRIATVVLVIAPACLLAWQALAAADQPIEPPAILAERLQTSKDDKHADRRTLSIKQALASIEPKSPAADAEAVNTSPLDNSITHLLERSDEAIAHGEVYQAVLLLREAEKLAPDHAEVVSRLGLAYTLSGNGVRGMIYLRRALRENPDDLSLLVAISQQVSQSNMLEESVWLSRALEQAGYPALGDYLLFESLSASGYDKAAASSLEASLQAIDQIDLDAQDSNGRGRSLALREMRVLKATKPELLLRLGDLYLSLGAMDEADRAYVNAAGLDRVPGSAIVSRRAYVALCQGKSQQAVDVVFSLLGTDSSRLEDAQLISYLKRQGVSEKLLADRLDTELQAKKPTLVMLASLAEVADKQRVLAQARRWIADGPNDPKRLAEFVSLLSFDDTDPGEVRAMDTLLAMAAEQMGRDSTRAIEYADAVLSNVFAPVTLLRAVKLERWRERADASSLLMTGAVYGHTLKTEEALTAYLKAIQADPSIRPRLGDKLAQLLFDSGRTRDALREMEAVGEVSPWESFSLKVRALSQAGELRDAFTLIDRRRAEGGDLTQLELLRVEIIAMNGNPLEAGNRLLRLVASNPNQEEVYKAGLSLTDGLLRYLDARHAMSIRQVLTSRLRTSLPDSVTGRIERARELMQSPDSAEEAEVLLVKALAVEPNSLQALALLGELYTSMGEEDSAAEIYDRLEQAGPVGVQRVLARARRAVDNGEMEQATTLLTRVIALEEEGVLPGREVTGDDAADLLQLLDAADPETDHDKLAIAMVKRFPDNVQLNNALGYKWAVQGKNLLQARAMIQRAMDRGDDNYSIVDSMAWVNYKLGDFAQAEAHQRRAIDLLREMQQLSNDPLVGAKAVLYDHMGDIMYRQGDLSSAIRHWQISRAQRLDDEDLMADPELRTLQARLDAKIDALRMGKEPPVEPVPGPEARGPEGHPAQDDDPPAPPAPDQPE